jgi:hypothetical protein
LYVLLTYIYSNDVKKQKRIGHLMFCELLWCVFWVMSIQVRISESVRRHALYTVKLEVFHPEVFVQYKGGEGQSNTTIEIAKYIV